MGNINQSGAAPTYRSNTGYPGGVYNLTHTYSKKFDEEFKKKSYTEPHCGNAFSWENSTAITIYTQGDGILQNYDLSQAVGSRMGTMHEINDEVNTYKLKQIFSIRETYEEVYNQDNGGIRNLTYILKSIIENKLKPTLDTYRMNTWANGAGNTKVLATALSKGNIIETLLEMNAMLDNLWVPQEGRAFFIGITDAIKMQLATELAYADKYIEKGAVLGEINMLGRSKVIQVPDKLMPPGVKIMCKWKGSSVDPKKLHWLQKYPHVEGYSGPVLNGIFRYDSFVLAHKANGIYCVGDPNSNLLDLNDLQLETASGKIAAVSGHGAPAGATLTCTVDGRNPKNPDNGNTQVLTLGTSTAATIGLPSSGTAYLRVYASATGKTNSGIRNFLYKASDGSFTAVDEVEI